ncbi:unnamed protein product [Alopecurus aequalis]
MEAAYPRFLVYCLLIVGSWIAFFLFHFQFFHLYLLSSQTSSRAALVASFLPASFLPAPSAPVVRAASCEGRYVYMLYVPSRFDVLSGCVEGSPAFQDEHSVCSLLVNAGMGPELPPATGNGSDGDTGVIPNTGWYNTYQYALEVIVHNRMRRYECLTDDPAAATAVYVPYYPALELQEHLCDLNSTVRRGPSSEFLRWLSSRPQWTSFGGRDHFMVAAKTTWMFRKDPAEYCGNDFLEQSESRNMTVLTYESNVWEPRDFAVPYPSYFHPKSAGEVAAWQARARAAERPWLFAFTGARRANGTLAIRDRIIKSCESSSRCRLVDCSHGIGNMICMSPRRVVSAFAASRFCLQPRGDSYMRRSSLDAIMAGCVPVFFHEASTFQKQYRWHHPDPDGNNLPYSVLIDADEVLEGKVDIEEVLARYTNEEVASMREEVIKMIPRFLYKDPTVRFQGDMRDAFDISFDKVMARMRRIKNGKDLG